MLIAGGSARIVNISSFAMSKSLNMNDFMSERPIPPMCMYGLSKLAVAMYTYVLALKLAGTGGTVNALHPGFVHTDNATNSIPKYCPDLFRWGGSIRIPY